MEGELKRKIRNLGLVALAFGITGYAYSCSKNSPEKDVYLQGTIIGECDTRGILAEQCARPFPFGRVEGYFLDIQSEGDIYKTLVSRFPSENTRFDNSLHNLASQIIEGKEVKFLYSYPYNNMTLNRFDSDNLGVLYTKEIRLLE